MRAPATLVALVSVSVATMVASGTVTAAAPGPRAKAGPVERERRLHLTGAEASSYLVNDWNKFQENYLPLYAGDDDPRTAWTLKTEGVGEWLRLRVTDMAGATRVRLKIRNGYQKSPKLFQANSRARGLTVVLLPSNRAVDFDLADADGWQEITVEQQAGTLEAVELRVRSIYRGSKYDDLCLSDVQLFVTATTPDNPAFEKQHLQKILEWKKERLSAARTFQSRQAETLPLLSQYVITWSPSGQGKTTADEAVRCNDSLCLIRAGLANALAKAKEPKGRDRGADTPAAAPHIPETDDVDQIQALQLAIELGRSNFSTLTAVRLVTRDKRPVPRVDGVCTPRLEDCLENPCSEHFPLPEQLGYLAEQTLVATEQSNLPTLADVLALKPTQCNRRSGGRFAYIQRGPSVADGAPGPVQAVILARCGMVEGREGWYPTAQPQLYVYGATDGRLQVVALAHRVAALGWDRKAPSPKVVHAWVSAVFDGPPILFEGATTIAGQ